MIDHRKAVHAATTEILKVTAAIKSHNGEVKSATEEMSKVAEAINGHKNEATDVTATVRNLTAHVEHLAVKNTSQQASPLPPSTNKRKGPVAMMKTRTTSMRWWRLRLRRKMQSQSLEQAASETSRNSGRESFGSNMARQSRSSSSSVLDKSFPPRGRPERSRSPEARKCQRRELAATPTKPAEFIGVWYQDCAG